MSIPIDAASKSDSPPLAASTASHPTTFYETFRAYLNLTKPRIIVLLLITTLGGMVIAARTLPPLGLIIATMVGGAFAAGGANALNCYIDRDIDPFMNRTRRRSLPAGRVEPTHALIYGLILGVLAFFIFILFVNPLSAILAEVGLLYYVLIYTLLLKRNTPQNIVIGGAAGALPPVVGWTAVTGQVDLLAIYLFAIIFLWTPPHSWALALYTAHDYTRARVPMLPVVRGEDETRRQILLYSILLVALTALLYTTRTMSIFYLISAIVLGAGLIYYAIRLIQGRTNRRARQLFTYSNAYLALIFLAMAIDRVAF